MRARESETDDAVDVARFVEFFNRKVEENKSNVPRVEFMTQGRERMLRFLCKKYGKRNMISAVEYVTRNDFLNGRVTGKCLVSLEWMLKEDNYIRVLENQFKNATLLQTEENKSPEARRERELQQRRAARQQEENERRQREQQREEWSRRAASIDEIRAILGENCVI